jgi:hypothetical protein
MMRRRKCASQINTCTDTPPLKSYTGCIVAAFERVACSATKMRTFVSLVVIVALVGPALAEEPKPRPIKMLKAHEASVGAIDMYVVEEYGTVRIDWDAVDTLHTWKADRTMSPMAQLVGN